MLNVSVAWSYQEYFELNSVSVNSCTCVPRTCVPRTCETMNHARAHKSLFWRVLVHNVAIERFVNPLGLSFYLALRMSKPYWPNALVSTPQYFPWVARHLIQWSLISTDLKRLLVRLLITTPSAVILLICMGVGGCLCLISLRVWCAGISSR